MRADRFPYFDARFIAFAHRGGFSPTAPPEVENSVRAFRGAWDLGFRYLETDVHLTADGVLIAFHDPILDHATDGSGLVATLPWREVSQARIGGLEPIPLFDELLETFPEARFNIDLKASACIEPLARSIRRHRAEERVCVASFSTSTLRAFRLLAGPRVATSASPVEIAVAAWAPGLRRYWPMAGQSFQIPVLEPRTKVPLMKSGLIRTARRKGARVNVWTINERADMEKLIDQGVDGLFSDDLVTLKEVLVGRGLWQERP
ncbi:MAG: glycerophosphodiester phosphodiesterase family protein [Propioniciclava sp.]|uniref:glycerophosphodiester phosphodiesterase family protein n=1 Tax=Propioniciclava sp. TaxID=2038686 RepID=UPI0039E46499